MTCSTYITRSLPNDHSLTSNLQFLKVLYEIKFGFKKVKIKNRGIQNESFI